MSAGTAILIVFGVLFFNMIILIIWAISIYNGLVGKRELLNEGWSSIDVQLKRRFNLIKNLVTIVKQYALHEKVRRQPMPSTTPGTASAAVAR